MNWYYAAGGQQQGPIDEAQLDALIQAGQVTPETLVWREGMASWQPLREARPTTAPASLIPSIPGGGPSPATGVSGSEVICVECGKPFAKENAIQYGTTWVCAGCKPVFLQRLREGAPIASAPGVVVTEADVLNREYKVEIGDCIERGWKLFSGNAGIVIGTSLVVAAVSAGCWIISALAGVLIPFANLFFSFLYTGPIAAGYMWFLLKLARGETATVGDAFAGFSRGFSQLVLSSLVQGLITYACMLPMFALGFTGFMVGRRGGGGPDMSAGMIIGAALLGMLAVCAMVYVNVLWTHSLLLVIDKDYKFWPAMQLSRRVISKRWWMTFLFLFVGGLISGAGVLACVIGLLVTVPLYFAMRVYLYEDNFRDLAKQPV